MAGDKMTAQIGSRDEPFRLFDTEQANFGVYGYRISAWINADGGIYYPGQVVNYSEIPHSDEDVVHLSARWCKKQYDIFAVRVPNECSSGLSGFERSYDYMSVASCSAGAEDENYAFTSWSFPNGVQIDDNPLQFQVLSSMVLSANFKDLRTLRMWTQSGAVKLLRYIDLLGYLLPNRENVLQYRAESGDGTAGPFNTDGELSAVSSLVVLSVADENLAIVGKKAFYGCQNLYTAQCYNISAVEESAFMQCGSLTDLYMPDIVIAGERSFAGCSSLTDVSLPGISVICENAFDGCSNMEHVYAPSCVVIQSGAFSNCSNLTAIDCSGVLSAGPSAFYMCEKLERAPGLSGIAQVERHAFTGCGKITSFDMVSADSVGPNAFQDCSALIALNIPRVASIDDMAFSGCSRLKRIDFGYTLTAVPNLISTAFNGISSVVCYMPRNDQLYDAWINDPNWKAVALSNNIYVYQHTQAEAAAFQVE